MGAKVITSATHATTEKEGIVKLTVPPADPQSPVAVGEGDPRVYSHAAGATGFTTDLLAAGESAITTWPMPQASNQIQTMAASAPCRVRLYASPDDAAADLSRPVSEEPPQCSGLLLEAAFDAEHQAFVAGPAAFAFTADHTNNIPLTVENTGDEAAAITLIFQVAPL